MRLYLDRAVATTCFACSVVYLHSLARLLLHQPDTVCTGLAHMGKLNIHIYLYILRFIYSYMYIYIFIYIYKSIYIFILLDSPKPNIYMKSKHCMMQRRKLFLQQGIYIYIQTSPNPKNNFYIAFHSRMHVSHAQELRYAELFSGEGNLFSEVKSKGHASVCMDILYADNFRDLLAQRKTSPFDILSTSGLAYFVSK